MSTRSKLAALATRYDRERRWIADNPNGLLFFVLAIVFIANALLSVRYYGLWHDDGWGVVLSDHGLHPAWFGSIYSRHAWTDTLFRDIMAQTSPATARMLLTAGVILPAVYLAARYLRERTRIPLMLCAAAAALPFLVPTVPDIPLGLNSSYVAIDLLVAFALLYFWPKRDSTLVYAALIFPAAIFFGISEAIVSSAFLGPVLIGAAVYGLRREGLIGAPALVAVMIAFAKVVLQERELSRAAAQSFDVSKIVPNTMELLQVALPGAAIVLTVPLVIGIVLAVILAFQGLLDPAGPVGRSGEAWGVALGLLLGPLLAYSIFQGYYSSRYAFASLFGLYALTALGLWFPVSWLMDRAKTTRTDDASVQPSLLGTGVEAAFVLLSVGVLLVSGFVKSEAKQPSVERDTVLFEGIKRDVFWPPAKLVRYENVHQHLIVLGAGVYKSEVPRMTGMFRLLTQDDRAIGAVTRANSCANPFDSEFAFNGRLTGFNPDAAISVIGRGGQVYGRQTDLPYLLAADVIRPGEALNDQIWTLYSVKDFRLSVAEQGTGRAALAATMARLGVSQSDVALNCGVGPEG